jgi:hypothetical protein
MIIMIIMIIMMAGRDLIARWAARVRTEGHLLHELLASVKRGRARSADRGGDREKGTRRGREEEDIKKFLAALTDAPR